MKRGHLIRTAAVALLALLFVSPLIVLTLGALRMPGLPPPAGFELVPRIVRWANFESAFSIIPLTQQMKNSLIVTLVAVPITILIGSLAGYAIAASDPRHRRRLILISGAALMVPAVALWVPRFVMFRWVGLVDTLWALSAPALMATTPFYVFVFALAYGRIPRGLFEAARLEGASELAVWRRVAWPLGRPAAFAVGVLAFAFHWSNFMDALLFIHDETLFTVALGLNALTSLEPPIRPLFLAASVIATIPVVAAFLAAHRAFLSRTLEV